MSQLTCASAQNPVHTFLGRHNRRRRTYCENIKNFVICRRHLLPRIRVDVLRAEGHRVSEIPTGREDDTVVHRVDAVDVLHRFSGVVPNGIKCCADFLSDIEYRVSVRRAVCSGRAVKLSFRVRVRDRPRAGKNFHRAIALLFELVGNCSVLNLSEDRCSIRVNVYNLQRRFTAECARIFRYERCRVSNERCNLVIHNKFSVLRVYFNAIE